MTTSLEQVLRFLDHVQEAINVDIVTAEIEQLSIEKEEEEEEEKPSLSKLASAFYHNGLRVCKRAFLFLHDIGDFHLKAIRAQYVAEGLVPRVHGHTGRVAPNAEEVKGIITFVMQYVETNAILLPGRIPGYKRDDIKLLPSSCTKRAVWVLYQESATSLSLRSVAYTTFCKVWRNFMGDVVVCKPMSDLCETCQKNSASIVRSFNKSEEEKSEV